MKGYVLMGYRRKRGFGFWRIYITALLICALAVSVFFTRGRPAMIAYAESVAQTAMFNAANEAISEIVEERGVTYGNLMRLSRAEDGLVTSAEADVAEINLLKSEISSRLAQKLDGGEYYTVEIPVGTFFSNMYTNAAGPKLRFRIQLTATAAVDFSHEIKSVGINQVLHIIMIDADISGSFVMIGYKDSITAETSAVAAQTVIVGAVPDAYTNVIESENDNTAGLINDYGAVTEN